MDRNKTKTSRRKKGKQQHDAATTTTTGISSSLVLSSASVNGGGTNSYNSLAVQSTEQYKVQDDHHSLDTPCCHLVQLVAADVFDPTTMASKEKTDTASTTTILPSSTTSSSSLLGDMIQSHLIQQRREQILQLAAAQAESETGKKKSSRKKRKRKKATTAATNIANYDDAKQTTMDENDHYNAATTTATTTLKSSTTAPLMKEQQLQLPPSLDASNPQDDAPIHQHPRRKQGTQQQPSQQSVQSLETKLPNADASLILPLGNVNDKSTTPSLTTSANTAQKVSSSSITTTMASSSFLSSSPRVVLQWMDQCKPMKSLPPNRTLEAFCQAIATTSTTSGTTTITFNQQRHLSNSHGTNNTPTGVQLSMKDIAQALASTKCPSCRAAAETYWQSTGIPMAELELELDHHPNGNENNISGGGAAAAHNDVHAKKNDATRTNISSLSRQQDGTELSSLFHQDSIVLNTNMIAVPSKRNRNSRECGGNNGKRNALTLPGCHTSDWDNNDDEFDDDDDIDRAFDYQDFNDMEKGMANTSTTPSTTTRARNNDSTRILNDDPILVLEPMVISKTNGSFDAIRVMTEFNTTTIERLLCHLILPCALNELDHPNATVLSHDQLQHILQQVTEQESMFQIQWNELEQKKMDLTRTYQEVMVPLDISKPFDAVGSTALKDYDILCNAFMTSLQTLALQMTAWMDSVPHQQTHHQQHDHDSSHTMWESYTNLIERILHRTLVYEETQFQLANRRGVIPNMIMNAKHRTEFRQFVLEKYHATTELYEILRKIVKSSISTSGTTTNASGMTPYHLPAKDQEEEQETVLWLRYLMTYQSFYSTVKGAAPISTTTNTTTASTTATLLQHTSLDSSVPRLVDAFSDLVHNVKAGNVDEVQKQQLEKVKTLVKILKECQSKMDKEYEELCPILTEHGSGDIGDSGKSTSWKELGQERTKLEAVYQKTNTTPDYDRLGLVLLVRNTILQWRCLRRMRAHLVDERIMPLSLIRWMAHGELSKNTTSSSTTTMMMTKNDTHYHACRGGGGKRRLACILASMTYQRLVNRCNEWHAELTRAELLQSMEELETSKDMESNHGSKASKKKKKKKKATPPPLHDTAPKAIPSIEMTKSTDSSDSDTLPLVPSPPPRPLPQQSSKMAKTKPSTHEVPFENRVETKAELDMAMEQMEIKPDPPPTDIPESMSHTTESSPIPLKPDPPGSYSNTSEIVIPESTDGTCAVEQTEEPTNLDTIKEGTVSIHEKKDPRGSNLSRCPSAAPNGSSSVSESQLKSSPKIANVETTLPSRTNQSKGLVSSEPKSPNKSNQQQKQESDSKDNHSTGTKKTNGKKDNSAKKRDISTTAGGTTVAAAATTTVTNGSRNERRARNRAKTAEQQSNKQASLPSSSSSSLLHVKPVTLEEDGKHSSLPLKKANSKTVVVAEHEVVQYPKEPTPTTISNSSSTATSASTPSSATITYTPNWDIIGVKDASGRIQSAQDFLVARLDAILLNENSTDIEGNPVVIIK